MLYMNSLMMAGHKRKHIKQIKTCLTLFGGRDSSVGIATRYGLDGPGIETWWGRDFPHPSRPALVPTQPPVQWVPGLSRGVKRPGRGVNHLPPSNAEVEGRVELYVCSLSEPSWPVIGWTLPFYHFQFTALWCISIWLFLWEYNFWFTPFLFTRTFSGT